MVYRLMELLDVGRVLELLNSFRQLTGISTAIIDMQGAVLVRSSNQTLCEQFFGSCDRTRELCQEARRLLLHNGEDAEQPVVKRCLHGLIDAAVPIRIQGRCQGALVMGQLFLEPPELDPYRMMAKEYGFDESAFLLAVQSVPVLTREYFDQALALLSSMTSMLADQGAARCEAAYKELQLQESALFLNQSQHIAQVGGWKVNPETSYLYWTEEVYHLVEHPRDHEPTLEEGMVYYAPSCNQLVRKAFQDSWETGNSFVLDCEIVTRTGRKFWAELRCIGRVETADGICLAGTFQDVTIRKLLEQDAQQWQQVFDSADFGLALSSVETDQFIVVNPAYAKQRGYTPQELIGQSIYAVYAPEAHEQLYQELQTLGNDGHHVFEAVQIRKDGSRFPVRVEATVVTDAAGKAVSRISCAFDITLQKQHADRSIKDIRRQKAQLRMYAMDHPSSSDLLDRALEEALILSDSAIGYIYMYDEESRILTFCAWSKSVMSSCSVMDASVSVFELDNTGLWGEAVRQRKPVVTNDYSAENPLKKGLPAGNIPLVRHMAVPVSRSSRIVAVVGVANKETDYTENDVRQLQLLMDGVWNIVERRRAEDELKMAKELAEDSCRLKSELLANLSHELRTPLNGVIGGSQLLRFTELTDEQAEYLDIVDEASANELLLVNNLLELVQMESEGITIDLLPFSLRRSMEEVVKIYQNVARGKGLQILLQLPDDLPDELIGDRVRLRQVLQSLIGNAIKFTEQGSVSVVVQIVAVTAEGMQLQFRITDTGIGIDHDKLMHIFEPFVQLDMSATRKFGGLGLGLTISRRLAAAMGGRIWAESKVASGSTFCLELTMGLPKAHQESVLDGNRLSILVAEDDHLSSMTSAKLLRKLGHTVVTAVDGKETVEIWQGRGFDLILMDLNMPIMNGFDALKRIRKIEQETGRPRTPVLAQTAYVRWNYHESLLSDGFDGCVAKPLIREELEEAIIACCRASAQTVQATDD